MEGFIAGVMTMLVFITFLILSRILDRSRV